MKMTAFVYQFRLEIRRALYLNSKALEWLSEQRNGEKEYELFWELNNIIRGLHIKVAISV